jgi:isopropylmalate/homocitrate/citramalate synthase
MKRSEVDLALTCDVDMVLLFIAASELHRKHKLMRTYDELEDCIIDVVDYARAHGLKVSFSTEDSTRADWEINERFFRAALDSGADRVGITDTVGCIHPHGISYLVSKVQELSNKPVSLHLHNDFGLAVANAIFGVQAGAEAISTTVNGIGERAGNLSLFEFVSSMDVLYGYDFNLKTHLFKQLSDMVSDYSGITVAKNQPLVGENIFSHESGIHVAAVMNNPATYECIPPELVGNQRRLILGKHTGTRVIEVKLAEQGVTATDNELELILDNVKKQGESNGSVSDNQFWSIANRILNAE